MILNYNQFYEVLTKNKYRCEGFNMKLEKP